MSSLRVEASDTDGLNAEVAWKGRGVAVEGPTGVGAAVEGAAVDGAFKGDSTGEARPVFCGDDGAVTEGVSVRPVSGGG